MIPLRSTDARSPRRTPPGLGGLLVVIGLCLAAPALAQDRAEARRLFQRAEAAFAEARWSEALEDYTSAYEAAPLPGFLFNIGQCHRKLEHWEVAADFFRRYLDAVPDAPNRGDAEDLLAEVEARAAENARPDTAEVGAGPSQAGTGASSAPASGPAEPPAETGASSTRGSPRLLTWISLGAGVALTGVAVLFALDLSAAQSSFDDPSLDCARRPDRCRALRDRGDTAATARTIFGVTGVAALAAGAVLLVLDLGAPARDREPALALRVGAGALDAVMTW